MVTCFILCPVRHVFHSAGGWVLGLPQCASVTGISEPPLPLEMSSLWPGSSELPLLLLLFPEHRFWLRLCGLQSCNLGPCSAELPLGVLVAVLWDARRQQSSLAPACPV